MGIRKTEFIMTPHRTKYEKLYSSGTGSHLGQALGL